MSGLDRFVATFLDLEVALRYGPQILEGLVTTVGIGLAVVATGLACGLALAVLRGCTRRHSKSRSSNPCAAIVFSDVRPVISKNTVDSGS